MWEPEDIGHSSTFRELKAIYFVLLSYVAELTQKRAEILLIIREPPDLLLSEVRKVISKLWLWIFLISVLLTSSFWKRNWSQGRLMKGQIFLSYFLTKMTGPSIPLYFELMTLNGALANRSVCIALQRPCFKVQLLICLPRLQRRQWIGPGLARQQQLGLPSCECYLAFCYSSFVVLWVPHFDHPTVAFGLFLTLFARQPFSVQVFRECLTFLV